FERLQLRGTAGDPRRISVAKLLEQWTLGPAVRRRVMGDQKQRMLRRAASRIGIAVRDGAKRKTGAEIEGTLCLVGECLLQSVVRADPPLEPKAGFSRRNDELIRLPVLGDELRAQGLVAVDDIGEGLL